MLLQYSVARDVWRLLAEVYPGAANKPNADEGAKLSKSDKHATRLAFADTRAAVTKQWETILEDLRYRRPRWLTRCLSLYGDWKAGQK
jgi:hypothetical protein